MTAQFAPPTEYAVEQAKKLDRDIAVYLETHDSPAARRVAELIAIDTAAFTPSLYDELRAAKTVVARHFDADREIARDNTKIEIQRGVLLDNQLMDREHPTLTKVLPAARLAELHERELYAFNRWTELRPTLIRLVCLREGNEKMGEIERLGAAESRWVDEQDAIRTQINDITRSLDPARQAIGKPAAEIAKRRSAPRPLKVLKASYGASGAAATL